jgi:hypothetical protein
MNEQDISELGTDFINPAVEIEPKTADETENSEHEIVIGSLLFDRDGYVPTASRRLRVRSSSIL